MNSNYMNTIIINKYFTFVGIIKKKYYKDELKIYKVK